MRKKIILILFFVLLLSVGTRISYARYSTELAGNADLELAKWNILVNNEDITNNVTKTMTLTSNIRNNPDVARGKIAPSSIGEVTIEVDPSNVDVSFTCELFATPSENSAVKNLKVLHISAYKPEAHSMPTIADDIYYDDFFDISDKESFTRSIYSIVFEWDDSQNSLEDNFKEAEIGENASDGNLRASIDVSLSFSQYTGK